MSRADPRTYQSSLLKSALDLGKNAVQNDDKLIFVPDSPSYTEQDYWKVLIVDDDPSVHETTEVALRHLTFENRTLQFISTYSAAETIEILPQHPDIAFILLDVIMETPDAGLKVAQYIREFQQNQAVRIVLRTGQPGQVPEESVVLHYDINDYKTKVELTQEKLFTTVLAALRAYRDLIALEKSQQALAQANAQLRQFNHDLEARVTQRTETLVKEIEERQKAETALKIYVNALTHDLRNPVIGLLQILESLTQQAQVKPTSPPSTQVALSVLTSMEDGCDRLLKMIERLLCAEEYSTQGVTLNCQPLHLATLMASLLKDWELKLAQKRITLEYSLPENLPRVSGDYHQIWRVFENLISNAVKYNQFGLKIEIRAEVLAAMPLMLKVTVMDDGVGIAAERCDSIFDLYQRGVHPSNSIRGLGIGLYICRQIIKAHGGEIGVISQLQEGAKFWLTLPIHQEN